jgi:hypothetical protein
MTDWVFLLEDCSSSRDHTRKKGIAKFAKNSKRSPPLLHNAWYLAAFQDPFFVWSIIGIQKWDGRGRPPLGDTIKQRAGGAISKKKSTRLPREICGFLFRKMARLLNAQDIRSIVQTCMHW